MQRGTPENADVAQVTAERISEAIHLRLGEEFHGEHA